MRLSIAVYMPTTNPLKLWTSALANFVTHGSCARRRALEADEAAFDRTVVNQQVEWGNGSALFSEESLRPWFWQRNGFRGATSSSTPILQRATRLPGVVHDRVVHQRKHVKIGTKFRWVEPKYVEMKSHKVPGSRKAIKTKPLGVGSS